MAGVATATRIKRRLPESETVLVMPAGLEKLQSSGAPGSSSGPAAKRLAAALPDLVMLPTRRVGIIEAQDIMPDLDEKEVTVTSPRGSVAIRYTDLILETPATVRLPRALQKAANVFSWPLPGFSAEPNAFDAALAAAAAQNAPVIVVGKGVSALDAVLLAREAGAPAVWLQTGESETPDMDPLLLNLALNALGSDVSRKVLQDTAPDQLEFRVGQEGAVLEAVLTPDGETLQSPCVILTSPLMGRHPILREEGVSLDPYGRLQVEPETVTGLHLIGSGSAVDPVSLPGTELLAPLYPGCEDCAEASALLCLEAISGQREAGDNAGSFGAASAASDDLCLFRAGYSQAEAARGKIESEYAVVSFAEAGDSSSLLALSLVCAKESRSLIGAQVLALGPGCRAAAEGLFSLCIAALAEGCTLENLRARPAAGQAPRLLASGASVLINKLRGTINGISPEELLASHRAGAAFFTLDLRPLHDWQAGHAPKAYNIPLLQLKKRLQHEVPHFTPIVLISEDGADAYTAACKLESLGASSLYVLDGGMRLWPYELEREGQ